MSIRVDPLVERWAGAGLVIARAEGIELSPAASGEIVEIRWLPLADPATWPEQPLAPLLTEHVLAALRSS